MKTKTGPCSKCVYWCNDKEYRGMGQCRFGSQKIRGIDGEGYEFEWPWTEPNDWCGDFFPRHQDILTPLERERVDSGYASAEYLTNLLFRAIQVAESRDVGSMSLTEAREIGYHLKPDQRRALLSELLEAEARDRKFQIGSAGVSADTLSVSSTETHLLLPSNTRWTHKEAEDLLLCIAAALAEKRKREDTDG